MFFFFVCLLACLLFDGLSPFLSVVCLFVWLIVGLCVFDNFLVCLSVCLSLSVCPSLAVCVFVRSLFSVVAVVAEAIVA